jgi:O-acetyl-ADP-ribose deacetylase (regulator of RNase III)
MGKGIALTIKNTWPEVYAADCLTTKGDASKLGTISTATVTVGGGKQLTVVNAYTQLYYHAPGVLLDYTALTLALQKVKQQYSGKKIALPKIGCTLAKGDWDLVQQIIATELAGEDVTLVLLP